MSNNMQKNGNGTAPASHVEDISAEGDVVLSPDELSDLVAQAIVEKLTEYAHVDAFLDTAISRVNNWRRELGQRDIVSARPNSPAGNMEVPSEPNLAQNDNLGRRRLYYKYENDQFSELTTKLLVSSFDNTSREGGIFELDFGANTLRKVFHANGRGFTKHEDGYLLVSRNGGFFQLDAQYNVKQSYSLPNLDLHGIACGPDGMVYIVETKHNRVGIYQLDPFERVDEIVVCEDREDRHHMNDLRFRDGKLLLSMFSTKDRARQNFEDGIFDGAIIEYDIHEKKPLRRLAEGLKMPHTLLFVGDELCYCESFALGVVKNGAKVAGFHGYTRGLAFDGRYLYVGQSRLRHRNKHTELILSNDAGIHVVDTEEWVSRFIPIPCSEIYGVMVI
jgi:hypothetical protein